MARRRMIDPGFWQSENMAKLTIRQRLLFIGLFSNADDIGRLGGKPALIRSMVFPYEDISLKEIENDLTAIQSIGSIIRYVNNGNSYIQVTGWEKYQRVDKPKASNIPASDDTNSKIDSQNESEIDSCLKERKGKEVKYNGQSASNDAGIDVDFDAEFEAWWKQYPRKRGKTEAQKSWHKLRKKGITVQQLTSARDNYTKEVNGKTQDYIMHGSTFLGPGDRWKDFKGTDTGENKPPPNLMQISPEQREIYKQPYIRRVEDG